MAKTSGSFTEGDKRAGRPKGAKNKVGIDLRERIKEFLEDRIETIIQDFETLKPRERAKFYTDLLQYALPRLQPVSHEVLYEDIPAQTFFRSVSDPNEYSDMISMKKYLHDEVIALKKRNPNKISVI